MKTENGFTLMNPDEFVEWLDNQHVNRLINIIQNHHTFIPSYAHFYNRGAFSCLKSMRNHHVINNGWKDIAQNLTTFPDGTIATGRPLEDIPAGIKNQNACGVCIEHLGNFDQNQDVLTDAQRETIINVNAALCKKFGLTPSITSIVYHHWFHLITGQRTESGEFTKTCPGSAFFGGNTEEAARNNLIPMVAKKLKKLSGIIQVDEPFEPAIFYYHVTAGNLNLRKGPGTNHEKAGIISKGSVLPVYEVLNKWLKVDPLGKWASGSFGLFLGQAIVKVKALNIRSGPGTQYQILSSLKKDEEVFIYASENNWSKIAINEQWVHNDYITMKILIPGT